MRSGVLGPGVFQAGGQTWGGGVNIFGSLWKEFDFSQEPLPPLILDPCPYLDDRLCEPKRGARMPPGRASGAPPRSSMLLRLPCLLEARAG
ncbi:MAG: hypothetical protein ACRDHS_04405 [Actinomycetota bacterium]